jgi:hypothetical protein
VHDLAVLVLHLLVTVARLAGTGMVRSVVAESVLVKHHPFVERLIGSLRRECLDRTLFWTAADLDELLDFQRF